MKKINVGLSLLFLGIIVLVIAMNWTTTPTIPKRVIEKKTMPNIEGVEKGACTSCTYPPVYGSTNGVIEGMTSGDRTSEQDVLYTTGPNSTPYYKSGTRPNGTHDYDYFNGIYCLKDDADCKTYATTCSLGDPNCHNTESSDSTPYYKSGTRPDGVHEYFNGIYCLKNDADCKKYATTCVSGDPNCHNNDTNSEPYYKTGVRPDGTHDYDYFNGIYCLKGDMDCKSYATTCSSGDPNCHNTDDSENTDVSGSDVSGNADVSGGIYWSWDDYKNTWSTSDDKSQHSYVDTPKLTGIDDSSIATKDGRKTTPTPLDSDTTLSSNDIYSDYTSPPVPTKVDVVDVDSDALNKIYQVLNSLIDRNHCTTSTYGCCKDNITSKQDVPGSNCSEATTVGLTNDVKKYIDAAVSEKTFTFPPSNSSLLNSSVPVYDRNSLAQSSYTNTVFLSPPLGTYTPPGNCPAPSSTDAPTYSNINSSVLPSPAYTEATTNGTSNGTSNQIPDFNVNSHMSYTIPKRRLIQPTLSDFSNFGQN